ncbi:hypothetical protein CKM354_000865900 [Cercospora kikuchii]|uniref:DUF2428 domain-containing protein n=1 Tax=Cercospora kikuchii TaxID=84275 RepID=A0A9P3FFJ0_9PEZI|nr:tRNA methylation protein TRM732 [Cercospora kikuchii]GIZ45496.1 hypothetical protein CKM354_000865900 [Cercospora kikuchii]
MCAVEQSRDAQILDEARLKSISRSIRDFVPRLAADDDQSQATQQLLEILDDVLFTSGHPILGIAHRVAAWNTLCSLIDQSLQSDIDLVKNVVWDQNVWKRAFELYLNHAHNARPKSSRQLLVTLTNALQKQAVVGRTQSIGIVSQTLAASLIDYEDGPRAKAAIQLLTNLLAKRILHVGELPSAFTLQRPGIRIVDDRLNASDLLEVLFRWLGNGDFGSTLASGIAAVLDKLDEQNATDAHPGSSVTDARIWRTPLESVFVQGNVNIDDLRAHILPMLFKRKDTAFASFLQYHGIEVGRDTSAAPSGSDPYAGLLYAALQTGKSLGLLVEHDGKTVIAGEGTVCLPMSFISRLLFESDRSARLTGLSLLLTSPSASKPLTASALNLVKRALATFFADVDADFRSEVFGAVQRLVDRLRAVTAALARATSHGKDTTSSTETPQEVVRRHHDLLKWFQRFLAQELRPTASYQRHISALRCLSILSRSGLDHEVASEFWSKSAQGQIKWPFKLSFVGPEIRRLLLDILLDPFEDVRHSAFEVLKLYCSVQSSKSGQSAQLTVANPIRSSTETTDLYMRTLDRAEKIMYQTGRADHADGVAYLYSLWYQSCTVDDNPEHTWQYAEEAILSDGLLAKLERFIGIAQAALSEAVARYPLHGLLTSLRYVLLQRQHCIRDHTQDVIPDKIFCHLQHIWELVKPILCDDAPEGYLPEELENTSNDTKETLSYCWRALKESSLLLGVLISSESAAVNRDERLAKWSTLCFTQLAELRHRGAFSTVAQTWVACCNRAQDITVADRSQLDIWYSDVLRMLQSNVTINTRRSAGLPSLLCGILGADRSGKLIARAVADLETIARLEVDAASAEEGSLAQVHAMNCFKDVLKNSRLAEQSEPFLAKALQLSADALRSDAWAIRNCGLMLFRAVIDRLLGTSDAHFDDDAATQKRISTEAYPQLLDVVLSLLKAPADGTTTRFEGVFPALQLLQLTRIPADRLSETCDAVEALTASPSWHVRDKAARTLASLTTLSDLVLHLDEVLSQGALQENRSHGLQLVTKYTVLRTASAIVRPGGGEVDTSTAFYDCSCLATSIGRIHSLAKSPVTKAASLDVVRACSDLLVSINATTRQEHDHSSLIMALDAVDATDKNAIETLRHILTDVLDGPALAVLRQAWSRLVAHYLMADTKTNGEPLAHCYTTIVELLQRDQGAVLHFLQALHPARVCNNTPMSAFVTKVCAYIMSSDSDMDLRCVALKTVIDLAEYAGNTVRLGICRDSFLLDSNPNQHYADQMLRIDTLQMDGLVARQEEFDGDLIQDISGWADACVAAINGHGIYTREAAAEALGQVTKLWQYISTEPKLADSFLQLCLAVYDLLNDDDEDIRLLASEIITQILAAGPTRAPAFEPIVASQRLLAFCIGRWPDSPGFVAHAFQRAFDIANAETVPRSVARQLEASTQNNTALFAEEKQNLYIDEAKEVRVWSQVLQKLSVQSIDKALIAKLATWVDEGLNALTAHSESNADGALGWTTTEPEIYVLGLQVVYAVELLFNLSARGAKIPLQPSELRKRLYTLITALEKAEGNCLWRWEAERILSESLSLKISSVSGFIGKGLEEHI